MKFKTLLLLLCCSASLMAEPLRFQFDFTGNKKVKEGYTAITAKDVFNSTKGYGYDFDTAPTKGSMAPFYFSMNVPDGTYRVTVVLGNKKKAANTTVRGESRRLFLEHIQTAKGKFETYSFTIHKRNTKIGTGDVVKIKDREKTKLNWDDKLTLEFNGKAPAVAELVVEQVTNVPTVFLCGNSTVVDQDNEPWASWGQMIPRFFDDRVCFANYAESGESASSFIGAKRLKKILSQMKKGDYIFIEFGHNDQKQKGPGKGAYYSFLTNLKTFVDEAVLKGGHPVLITPTQRRSFDPNGRIKDTHENYPEAMRWMAQKEHIDLIDLNELTRTFYEAMGPETSKKAFVHYPAGSYPGQFTALADNTHFNPYGAYEISKCVIEGMKKLQLPLVSHLRSDYVTFDPAHPDDVNAFQWDDCNFSDVVKPDGN